MLVRRRVTADPHIHRAPQRLLYGPLRRLQKNIPLLGPPKSNYVFNSDYDLGIDWLSVANTWRGQTDVLILHWINKLITAKQLRQLHDSLRVPILWVMMDQEPVTGGCHYSFGCQRFHDCCGHCPLLGAKRETDRSRAVWLRKRQYLADLPIIFIAPTSWCERQVLASSLFSSHRVARIPLAIDTAVFHSQARDVSRVRLNLPMDKRLILFRVPDANDSRKGGDLLIAALQQLRSMLAAKMSSVQASELLMLSLGGATHDLLASIQFPTRDLGSCDSDQKLAAAYQAADLFVCPSVEDAGPMMIPEAMLCGTPVVAFDSGGAPDLIRSLENGYLAQPRDAQSLARGLLTLLEDQRFRRMGEVASKTALSQHAADVVVSQYVELLRSPQYKLAD
jgi:glycosyltransferase involved in cell wall biosynthesis